MADGQNRPAAADWLFVAFIAWFGSYAYLYVYEVWGLKPVLTYVAMLLFAFLYWLSREIATGGRPLERSEGFYMLLGWLGAYLAYGAFAFLHSSQSDAAVQTLITLVETVLLTASFAGLMLAPRRLRLVVGLLAVLSVLGSAVNIFDFINPFFSRVSGRAAGLYANPTIAGNFIAIAAVGGIAAVRPRLHILYLLFCGIGVLITFSRESWIIYGLAIIWLGWQGQIGNLRGRALRMILAVVAGSAVMLALFAGAIGHYVAQTPLMQHLTPNTAARLGIGANILETSSSARKELAMAAIHESAKAPWIGHGLGYVKEWGYALGPHNMYLLFLAEGGLVGLTLYLLLMLGLWRYSAGVGRVMTLQVIVSGLFSHNHLDQPAMLILIAFIIVHGASHQATGEPSWQARVSAAT